MTIIIKECFKLIKSNCYNLMVFQKQVSILLALLLAGQVAAQLAHAPLKFTLSQKMIKDMFRFTGS